MSWNKEKLLLTFNRASVPLYGLGKGIQSGAAWLNEQGYNVYGVMPEANRFVRHHMASFFGAYALAWLAGEAATYLAEKFVPGKLKNWTNELSVAFSSAALTTWELTHKHGGRFDWGDMGVYAVAMGLFYALNHKWQKETPATAPAVAGVNPEALPGPKTS